MARIPLTKTFNLIPEGTHVFRIYAVSHDEDFGKIEVKMVTASGLTHTERFSIKSNKDEYNEKALAAFSFFAKTALDIYDADDVDPADLVDHYIKAEVVYHSVPARDDPSKTITFANLGDKYPAYGFETTPSPRALTLGKTAPAPAPCAPPGSGTAASAPGSSGTPGPGRW